MKKVFSSMVFALAMTTGFAQKFDKVETPYVLGKFEEAKNAIDKIIADPKAQSNPEALLWYASVYSRLFEDSALSAKYPEAGDIAYANFKKYEQLDPAYKVISESPIPGKTIVNVLYGTNWSVGYSKFYEKKKYDSAFKYLSRSAEISDLIGKNKWAESRQALDTLVILFSAYAAENAKQPAAALKYLQKLADMRIAEVRYVGEIKEVYYLLLQHFIKEKNYPSFSNYLEIAKSIFPKNAADWADFESKYMEDNFSLAEKTETYDKKDKAGTLTANQYLDYGNMFYNLKDEDKAQLDSVQISMYRFKSEDAFVKAYGKDNTLSVAAFNVGLINYNDWVDLDDKWRENVRKMGDLNRSKANEKDPKKKVALEAKIKKEVDALKAVNNAIEKQQHGYAGKGIDWFEKSFALLSAQSERDRTEKNLINKSIDNLANFYEWKREKSKGNAADYDKYDALYKKYDALHGKY